MLCKRKWEDNWTVAFLALLCLKRYVKAGSSISLILWIQLVFMDFSNWRWMREIISILVLAKSSFIPGWRTHPSVNSLIIWSARSWLHNFSDVNAWVEGHPGRWGRCSGWVVKLTWCPSWLGGCLCRLGQNLCRTSWEVFNPHVSPVPGIVWGAASVTPLAPLLAVPVIGGLSRRPGMFLEFLYVLLLFAFCSEDADLQFPAGHLAKAKSPMWHSWYSLG